jgi:hypothetical protein
MCIYIASEAERWPTMAIYNRDFNTVLSALGLTLIIEKYRKNIRYYNNNHKISGSDKFFIHIIIILFLAVESKEKNFVFIIHLCRESRYTTNFIGYRYSLLLITLFFTAL